MSLKCIDRAMARKLKGVYPNVVFGPLGRALEVGADTLVDYEKGGMVVTSDPYDYEVTHNDPKNPVATGGTEADTYGSNRTSKNGVVAFPLIAFDRIQNSFEFGNQANDPLIRRGWMRALEVRERAFPVNLMYQIDIISDRRFEVDEIWRELTYYLYTDPNISVLYSEGTEEEFEEKFPILMRNTDTVTDVETFTEKGIIYRQTISVQILEAKMLFRKDVPLIKRIPIHVEPIDDDWLVESKEVPNNG